jgi:hypothetical protein
MIELENDRVRLAAVSTRMQEEIVEHVLRPSPGAWCPS